MFMQEFVKKIPTGRGGDVVELVNLALYLLSDYSNWVNGQVRTTWLHPIITSISEMMMIVILMMMMLMMMVMMIIMIILQCRPTPPV